MPELVHTETDEQGITYNLFIQPDDLSVRGNAVVSGDAAFDRKTENEILERLADGDIWAWADVECQAEYKGFTGSDYLGACSYRNTEQFVRPGDYWDDMKAESKRELLARLQRAKVALESLS